MPKHDFDKKTAKYCHRGWNKQFEKTKRDLEESRTILSDIKSQLKQQQTDYNEVKEQLNTCQQAITEISQQMTTQQEIMQLFYKEYLSLKKRQGKAQLMNYVRMRDAMMKDIAMYEEHNRTNSMGYRLLKMYVNELTEILEDQSVEIITAQRGEKFNPEIQKPVERVTVYRAENDNLINKVYNCGYRWEGIMLKKIEVSVCVCR